MYNTVKMTFVCERCGHSFKCKHHLKQHLKRVTMCEPLSSTKTTAELFDENFEPKSKPHKCNYCDKTFSHPSNKSRHQSTCTARSVVEDATNDNQANQVFQQKASEQINMLLVEHLKELRVELAEMRKMQQTNVVNNINNQNITINNNVQINSFGKESYDHISTDFIKSCLMNRLPGVKSLIEKIHFSDEALMNKNVRLKSIKNSLVEVRKDDKWVPKDTNEAVDTMIKKGCFIMNKCYYEDTDIMDRDINDLDNRIQQFLVQIMDNTDNNYYSLRRRILALIIEYSV